MGAALWGRVLLALALLGTALAVWRFRRYGILLAAVAAAGVLCSVDRLWQRADLHSGLVSVLVLQRALWTWNCCRCSRSFSPLLAGYVSLRRQAPRLCESLSGALLIALVAAGYVSVYAESPITLREASVNSRGRIALEQGLANVLAQMPPSATLLMYEAEHAGALRLAGIPLRHVISEAEHPDWEWALLDPAHHADYIVACQGDPVWAAVRHHQRELRKMVSITVPGQATCTIYKPK